MISLVLWWWTCKGFIHLWVYKYLQEHNIKISSIAGTSMGAILWSLIACGKDFEYIYDHIKGLSYTQLISRDFKNGLFTGKKIIQKLKWVGVDGMIEETKIPLKIIATNIDTWLSEAFWSGSILPAIHSSICIPWLLWVYHHINGNYYIDGWMTDNLPIAHVSGSNHVVAVSCMWLWSYSAHTSSTILWMEIDTSFLTAGTRIVARSLDIMMCAAEDSNLMLYPETILIRPNLGHLNSFDLSILDEAIEIGYNEAKKIFTNRIY